MTMIISGSDGLEFPDGSDQGTAFTGNAATITSGTIATARLATGTANSSTYLRGDQTWAAVPAATPGGSTRQVQYNNAGAFGGDSGFVYDTSGNLGLGVTPSAWSSYKAIQVGQVGAFWANPSGADVYVSANTYFGSGADRYIATGSATLYQQNAGAHAWKTAASGTAGNAITFTQAMTLDASGNLGVGTTSPSSGGKLAVYGKVTYAGQNQVALFYSQTSGGAVVNFQDTSSTSGTAVGGVGDNLTFYSSSGGGNLTERMRIDSSGRVGIGTASPSSLLDVNTSAAGNFVARITNNSGASSSDHALLVETSTASAAKIISARNAGVERFLVTGSGDVSVFNSFLMNSGYGSAAIAYGCRAWVNFNGTGTVAIRASGNVSSVSDNGTGDYTVNFSTAMPDANYAAVGTAGKNGTGGNTFLCDAQYYAPTTSGQRMLTFNYSNGTLADAPMVSFAVVR